LLLAVVDDDADSDQSATDRRHTPLSDQLSEPDLASPLPASASPSLSSTKHHHQQQQQQQQQRRRPALTYADRSKLDDWHCMSPPPAASLLQPSHVNDTFLCRLKLEVFFNFTSVVTFLGYGAGQFCTCLRQNFFRNFLHQKFSKSADF